MLINHFPQEIYYALAADQSNTIEARLKILDIRSSTYHHPQNNTVETQKQQQGKRYNDVRPAPYRNNIPNQWRDSSQDVRQQQYNNSGRNWRQGCNLMDFQEDSNVQRGNGSNHRNRRRKQRTQRQDVTPQWDTPNFPPHPPPQFGSQNAPYAVPYYVPNFMPQFQQSNHMPNNLPNFPTATTTPMLQPQQPQQQQPQQHQQEHQQSKNELLSR